MEDTSANPFLIALFFMIRCLVPLLVMFGITYLLKRLGLIVQSPKPPPEWNSKENNNQHGKGDLSNAKS